VVKHTVLIATKGVGPHQALRASSRLRYAALWWKTLGSLQSMHLSLSGNDYVQGVAELKAGARRAYRSRQTGGEGTMKTYAPADGACRLLCATSM